MYQSVLTPCGSSLQRILHFSLMAAMQSCTAASEVVARRRHWAVLLIDLNIIELDAASHPRSAVGSFSAFAAPVASGRFGKQRRSLRSA